MLAVPADRLPAALGDLDPGNRALLDLSLRRGVSDAEIGELLRKEPADVARGRDAVLELLADALDVGGHDRRERVRQAVAALPDDAWRAPTPPRPPKPPEPRRPEPPTPPPVKRERDAGRATPARDLDDDFYFAPEPRRRRRSGVIVVLILLTLLAAVGALLLAGSDDDDEPSAPSETPARPAPSDDGEPAERTGRLTALGGGRGGGRIEVTDAGTTITLRGLPDPDGAYQVWLYDSVVRAQSLGTIPGGSGRLEGELPADARRYRFIDVSLEPADGNPNHSGDSVLRTPLRKLLGD